MGIKTVYTCDGCGAEYIEDENITDYLYEDDKPKFELFPKKHDYGNYRKIIVYCSKCLEDLGCKKCNHQGNYMKYPNRSVLSYGTCEDCKGTGLQSF